MRDDVIRVVETYIDAVRRNDANGLPLHPDVVFESPLGRYEGLAAFQKELADFVQILKSIVCFRQACMTWGTHADKLISRLAGD
jgi:hypothetical protein